MFVDMERWKAKVHRDLQAHQHTLNQSDFQQRELGAEMALSLKNQTLGQTELEA